MTCSNPVFHCIPYCLEGQGHINIGMFFMRMGITSQSERDYRLVPFGYRFGEFKEGAPLASPSVIRKRATGTLQVRFCVGFRRDTALLPSSK
jgi:hypothetical protein